MKKLLLFFLLFPLSVLSHEWEKIFINHVEDIFYYDKESVKVSGETISVLMLMDYGTPYDDGIISLRSRRAERMEWLPTMKQFEG